MNRRGAWLTHGCLVALLAALFALLLWTPIWIAAIPCILLNHRIGILLHEYIHGIPLRRYRHNLIVLACVEPLALTFGLFELFRCTHLAHHRWLNSERDPAFAGTAGRAPRNPVLRALAVLELSQHAVYVVEALRGRVPYLKPRRMVLGFVLSLAAIAGWFAAGRPDVVVALLALNLWNGAVSTSLRGAAEHHGPPGEARSVNEYRALIPMFNINRHVHHHAEPTCPWYRLEFRGAPLPARCYLTHWYHAYVKRDYVLLDPPP